MFEEKFQMELSKYELDLIIKIIDEWDDENWWQSDLDESADVSDLCAYLRTVRSGLFPVTK